MTTTTVRRSPLHDLHLLARIQRAEKLRLDRGQFAEPTGALRHPPRRPDA